MTYMHNIFSFHFETRYTSSITWRCSVRTSTIKCPVIVKQSGDRFAASNAQHIHPADLGRRLKAEVSAKIRKKKNEKINKNENGIDMANSALIFLHLHGI